MPVKIVCIKKSNGILRIRYWRTESRCIVFKVLLKGRYFSHNIKSTQLLKWCAFKWFCGSYISKVFDLKPIQKTINLSITLFFCLWILWMFPNEYIYKKPLVHFNKSIKLFFQPFQSFYIWSSFMLKWNRNGWNDTWRRYIF